MKFKSSGATSGDCTTPYDVFDYKANTIEEFIKEVINEFPDEWGYIGIKNGDGFGVFGNPCCEYRYGKLLSGMKYEYLNREIESITSRGGWSRMDYLIKVK